MNEWEWNLLEDREALDSIEIAGVVVRPGHRVRLRPRDGGDVLDIALRGQVATVESLEEDYEGVRHICVVLDDDPGRDLGMMRQPGHRFFFTPAEIEPIDVDTGGGTPARMNQQTKKPAILIAGIGNIFLGDDGFGVEVAQRLMKRTQADAVRVVDFGIRGLDLVYALQDGYETTILVDAYPHGQAPGTVSLIELSLEHLEGAPGEIVQAHAMNPMNVLRMAKAMNVPVQRIVLVGCEPLELGGEEGYMGLSSAVEAALDEAVRMIESTVSRILDGRWV